jgi:thiol-disulfide isomerase/thioredoxin
MKYLLRIAVLFLGFVLTVIAPISTAQPVLEGWMAQFILNDPPLPAPQTEFRTATGDKVTLAAFKGKVILVNFWATWCAPCIREMPSLDRLQAVIGPEKFQIVAVNEDRAGTKTALPFLKKLGIAHYTSYFDRDLALARALHLRGMPTTFLIDAKGNVIGALAGIAEWDAPEAVALIRYYIDRL